MVFFSCLLCCTASSYSQASCTSSSSSTSVRSSRGLAAEDLQWPTVRHNEGEGYTAEVTAHLSFAFSLGRSALSWTFLPTLSRGPPTLLMPMCQYTSAGHGTTVNTLAVVARLPEAC